MGEMFFQGKMHSCVETRFVCDVFKSKWRLEMNTVTVQMKQQISVWGQSVFEEVFALKQMIWKCWILNLNYRRT
jgi:hypothetical protein